MRPGQTRHALLLVGLLAACGPARAPQAQSSDHPTLAPQFGGARRAEAYGLAPHGTGAYVVGRTAGSLYGPHHGDFDAFLAKYDAAGTLVWGRQFGTAKIEDAWRVATDAQDSAYVVGRNQNGAGSFNLFLRKYTAQGDLAWARQVGPDGSTLGAVAAQGQNIYVPYVAFGEARLDKYDAGGTLLWTLKDRTRSIQTFADIALGQDGSVYLAGTDRDGMLIEKVSPDGLILWRQSVRFQDFAEQRGRAVAVLGEHVYLVGDFQWWASGERKALVTKFNPDGAQLWQQPYHNLYGTDFAWDAAVDSGGDLYLAGYRVGGPHPSYVGYVSKIAPEGGYPLWTRTVEARTGAFTFAVLAATRLGVVLTPGRVGRLPPRSTEVYTAGYAYETVGEGHTGSAFLRRLDSASGDTVWTR